MAGAGPGRMRKTKSGQGTGEEVRAFRPNHRAWALRSESLENSVLCIWRAGTVPKGSQGLRWEERAGLDPASPHNPGSQKSRPGQQPVTDTAWTTLSSWFLAQSKNLKPAFPGNLGALHPRPLSPTKSPGIPKPEAENTEERRFSFLT